MSFEDDERPGVTIECIIKVRWVLGLRFLANVEYPHIPSISLSPFLSCRIHVA